MKKIILLLILVLLVIGCTREEIVPVVEEVQSIEVVPEPVVESVPEQIMEEPSKTSTIEKGGRPDPEDEAPVIVTDKQVYAPAALCTENCENYCLENSDKCEQYCRTHQDDAACSQTKRMWVQGGMPGICDNPEDCARTCDNEAKHEECMDYCREHPENDFCDVYFREDRPDIPTLSMPFKVEDYVQTDWGMWPFCVHGGDHPEGHGGIDFELKEGTKILASADCTVEELEVDDPHGAGGGIYLLCGGIAVDYAGVINIQVKKGDEVKKGQFIGNPVKTSEGEPYIHWGTNNYIDQKIPCPLEYLDDEFKTFLNQKIKSAVYIEKGKEPDICNCEELPYKETMKRGP